MAYAGSRFGYYSPDGPLNALPLAVLDERFDADLDVLQVPSRNQTRIVDDLIGIIQASRTFFADAGVTTDEFIMGIEPEERDYLPPVIG